MMKRYSIVIIFFTVIVTSGCIDNSSYPESIQFSFPEKYHLAQTFNDCGPYSVMAVINSYPSENVSVENLKKEMTWRLKNNYTLPFGLESLLKNYMMKTKTHLLFWQNSKAKIEFIKYTISKNRRAILLGKIPGTNILHYITILGYDKSHFFCYDSFQKRKKGTIYTIDTNGKSAGNKSYSDQELIEFWNKGGYNIFYRNYCIVIYGKKR